MTIDFIAAVLASPVSRRPFDQSTPLALETVTCTAHGPHEVIVEIQAASLCRSDLSVIEGVRAWPMPIIPGHEASGVVEEIGPGVTGFKPGDHVVLVYQAQCGICPCCEDGRPHLCAPGLEANRAGALLSGGPRLSLHGAPVHHHMGLSAFAQKAIVSEHSLVKVDDSVPFDIAALFGCGVLCGAGSILKTGAVQPGESVAIVGTGGVGSSAILGARLAGAERIIAVDLDEGKCASARALGATDTIIGGPDAAGEILELTNGGVNCALESAGNLEAFTTAYDATARGGRVVTLGLVSPETPYPLDIAGHVTSAKSIHGSYMGSCNPQIDIPEFVSLYQSGRFPVDQLISHTMPLKQVNLALERMAASTALRQILHPN